MSPIRRVYLKKKEKQKLKKDTDSNELDKKKFDSVLEAMLKTQPELKQKNKPKE